MSPNEPVLYKDAGVDIDEADRAVTRIKGLAKTTMNANVLTGIGSFGAGYRLTGYSDPVLVSSADGVGTKLRIAIMTGRHNTIGEDLVNHCVNDIAVQGAVPLYFLDYFAAGKLNASVTAQVIEGVARGCKNNGCALIGGETAEMPGMYSEQDYDLAGFITGVVERSDLLTGSSIVAGDVLLGLPSTGLHTNGYSLARKLFFEVAGHSSDTYIPELNETVADALLKVHRSYLTPLRRLVEAGLLKGAAHITGGGLTDNLPRMLPNDLAAAIRLHSWPVLPIFDLLKRIGNIPDEDWRRSFNLGLGMVFAVAESDAGKAQRLLADFGETTYQVGSVVPRQSPEGVIYQ
jgi:phosphoribosylformylglycinamidine cyclo-ligase